MIGLGKMGANMTTRLLHGGHRVVVYDLNESVIREAEAEGAEGARTLDEVVEKLPAPRAVRADDGAGWLTVRVDTGSASALIDISP